MKYTSTRGQAPEIDFEAAMMTGLAPDGGLYVPTSWPQISHDEIAAFAGQSYEGIAFKVMRPFIGDAFSDEKFREIVVAAYAGFRHSTIAPMVQLGPNEFLLELFHGPTLAFKDVAMQLIGQMFEHKLQERGTRLTIVGATSGDTGSAAIEAFKGLSSVDVFIMFPHGRVSDVQRRQMTTPDAANVHAVAIEGDFDDCQARLKDMFNDHGFRDGVSLAGVNSINWARVMAQVVYYFTAAVSLGAPTRSVKFCVPTGNFGDIFAGYVAKQMGLPIDNLIAATNHNDILHRTIRDGDHRKGGVTPSISPSMDIQVSSNFERLLFELVDRDPSAVRAMMEDLNEDGGFQLAQGLREKLVEDFSSGSADETDTKNTIKNILATTGEVVCPHTAVGLKVAQDQRGAKDVPMVTLATAHPAKFPAAVEAACGIVPDLPPHMAGLADLPERMTRLPNDLAAIQTHIKNNIKGHQPA